MGIPDFSGKLVVQSVIFSLLDAIPPHDLHLVQVVTHLRTKSSNYLLNEILNEITSQLTKLTFRSNFCSWNFNFLTIFKLIYHSEKDFQCNAMVKLSDRKFQRDISLFLLLETFVG